MSKIIDNIRHVNLGAELRYNILREFLDISSVLDYLGITYSIKGDECLACCPYHDDRHPSWSIKWNKASYKWGVHNCFSCRVAGNVVSLTKDMLNLGTYHKALVWLEEFAGISGQDIDFESLLLDRRQKTKIAEHANVMLEFPYLSARSDQHAYNFLRTRHVTESQIDRHDIRVGSGRYKDSVIFPIKNSYGIVSFYARFYSGEIKGLYHSGKDVIKNNLYNYNNSDYLINTCYLVEGCFDVLAVERALIKLGLPNYKNVFATLGPTLHQEQSHLLGFFDYVVIIPDMDGKAEGLVPSCKDVLCKQKLFVAELPAGEDPDSVSLDVLCEKLTNIVSARTTFNTFVVNYG